MLSAIADLGCDLQTIPMVGETNSIRVNNEHRRVEVGLTVRQLIEELGMAKAAVERNAELLTDFDEPVEDGDDYEIFEKL
jgi:sulfur carrier protein ThiS